MPVLTPAMLALLTALVQLAIQVLPEIFKEGQLLIQLLSSGKEPTAEQQAEIDAALDTIHKKLQEHIAAKNALPPAPSEAITE